MPRLRELDGLRALAALAVLASHFNAGQHPDTWAAAWVAWAGRYGIGATAVSFFYVLSAFLLTTLAVREIRTTGAFNRWRFLGRRVARIWPLYWLAVLVALYVAYRELAIFGANMRSFPWLVDHLWLYALYLGNWSLALAVPGWHVDRSPPVLTILWSVAVEEQFYLLYALVAGAALLSGRRMLLTTLAAVALSVAYRHWHLTAYQPHQELNGVYYATFSYLDHFGFGAAAGWLLATDGRAQRWLRVALRFPPMVLLIAGLVYGVSIRWQGVGIVTRHPEWLYTLSALAMAVLVAWSVANRDRWLIRWTLAAQPLAGLGVISYGLYVWHPVGHSFASMWLNGQPAAVEIGAYFGLTILLALVSYWIVERPAILAMRRWQARPPRVADVPVSVPAADLAHS